LSGSEVVEEKYQGAKPIDIEFNGRCLVRIVKQLNLIEVACLVPQKKWVKIAKLVSDMPVERPPERIIARGRKVNLNIFLDNGGAFSSYDPEFVYDPDPLSPLSFDPAKVVIPVRPGRLAKHGYRVDASERTRRMALKKAVEEEGDWLPVFRHLIARATQLKRISPRASKIMRKDAEWLKKMFRW
jgi:hypothetical protein